MRRLALLALTLIACRTQPLGGSDGGTTQCASPYHLEPVTIDNFSPSDLNICPVSRAPVMVLYHHGSCEPPAPVQVAFAADGSAIVTARIWRGAVCHDSIAERTTVLLSENGPLMSGTVLVKDGAPGGTASTEVPIQPLPKSGACQAVSGMLCSNDQCQAQDPKTRCDLDNGGCLPICRVDGDCSDSAPSCNNGLCTHGPNVCPDCAPTEHCVTLQTGAACRLANMTSPGAPCTVDTDCGAGGLCQNCACLIPCRGDGDCKSGHCDRNAGCVQLSQ